MLHNLLGVKVKVQRMVGFNRPRRLGATCLGSRPEVVGKPGLTGTHPQPENAMSEAPDTEVEEVVEDAEVEDTSDGETTTDDDSADV